jgi:DNA mismatch repair ATPase MutS
MEETFNIVKHATRHSIAIIDELGRGTSTFDGVAIAYSVLKYIHNKIK